MNTQRSKSIAFFAVGIGLLLLAAPLMSGAEKTGKAAKGSEQGSLFTVTRAPNLGNATIVSLTIDGKKVSIGFGQSYRTMLAPGQHIITTVAGPNPSNPVPTKMTLDVKPGHTYNYTAKIVGDSLILRKR
jgi:hypothetical protein